MAHYFGESARDVFFTQYHHLARHRLIEGNDRNKLTRKAKLQSEKARHETGAGSISRVALQPKGSHDIDFPFAPKRPSTAGHMQASIASTFGNQSSFLFEEGNCSLFASLDGPSASVLTSFYDTKSKVPVQSADGGDSHPQSPRTTYLEGCLNSGLKPRASLILRKNVTTEINLKHNLIGDKMAVVFAKALRDLPLISSLNICDNALTDEGATAILGAVVHLPSITCLDISMNKLDANASTALAEYLRSKSCPLKILHLSGADIDDSECERFIMSLRFNTTIKELDLSNNKIGVSEPLNVVKPDFRTGAEALGNFLMKTDCPLEILHLQWNMIRLDGAVAFANSLRLNTSLTELDISYNSLGKHGGEALGDALVENKTLRSLNVCGNSLNATACFTICIAIEENFVLRNVILDNNAIGTHGAKALLELPSTVGNRVRVSAERCNISLIDRDFKFNRNDPGGTHVLNLDLPFERAVAFKILQIIAVNTSYRVSARYDAPISTIARKVGNNKSKEDFKLIRGFSDHKVKVMDREQVDLMSRLKRVARASLDMEMAVALFNEFDEDGSGSIDHDELFKLLSKLGVEVDEKVVNNAMITYDLDGQGSLEMAEFLQFLRAQHDEAISRLREMAECPIMCLASNPTVRYIPPRRGVLHLTVTDSFQTSSTQRVLSSFDYNNILKLIKNSGLDVAESFVMALKNMKLRQAEATKVFAHMYAENRDKSKCLGVLLPLMLDSKEARGVVDELIGDDDVEMNKLTSLIGSAIKPILGFYDGFYDLDLARETDRVCVLQLLNRSQDVLEKRKKMYEDVFGNGMIGDCSQKQNWSAFRNEYFNGSDFIITPAMFTPMPTSGKICFDFVASDHPPNSVTSFSDRRCISCLITMGLIDEKDRSRAQDMLNTWREYGIVTSSGKGEELPMADYARAYSIQQFSNKFRMSLKERSEQMAKAIQREDVFAYKQRQAKLAAKRNNYNRQRNSGILKPVISQRKASTRDIRRKQSIRKPSRALTRVGGTDSAQLVASIKEFQALASPDIDGLGQVDEDEEHSDGTSSDEDDYYDEAEGSTITSLTQPPIPGGVSKRIRGLSLQPIGENKTATTISDRSHSRAGSVVSSPLTTGTSCPLDYMYRGLCSNGPARNSLPGITPRSSAIEAEPTPVVRRINTYTVVDTDDDADLELFSPKLTSKVTYTTGQNKFSFDFLEANPSNTLDDRGGILHGMSSMDTFDKGHSHDEESVEGEDTGGLISGLEELSKLNRSRGQRGLGSSAPSPRPEYKGGNAVLMGGKQKGARKDSVANNLTDDEKTSVPNVMLVRKTSSLSIAMDYLAGSMHQVALEARKKCRSDMSMPIRANGIFIAIEKIFSKVWISSRHLALILSFFTIGKEKKTTNFGTYRVELFVTLFSRIVDPQNLDSVLKILTPYEAACVFCRIGWLNLFNPMKPDGAHVLDLSCADERCVIKQLALLSLVEPGENIRASRFRWRWEDNDLQGWVLLAPWVSEEQMPHRGVMYLDYYSGEGESIKGCVANTSLRRSLMSLVYSKLALDDKSCEDEENEVNGTLPESCHTAGGGRDMRFATMHMDLWKKMFIPKRLMANRGVAINGSDEILKESVAKLSPS